MNKKCTDLIKKQNYKYLFFFSIKYVQNVNEMNIL